MAEEMWAMAGQPYSIFNSEWPEYDANSIVADTITLAVQVNGKLRGQVEVPADADETTIIAEAKTVERVRNYIQRREIVREIYVNGRLVNLVVK